MKKLLFGTIIFSMMLVFAPLADAQTYWLQYSMLVGSTESGTQNNSYDSGKVQSSLLTTNLTGPGSKANAHATPTASFGLLHLMADCSVNNPNWDGNGYISRFEPENGNGTDLSFQDELTITSATLSIGTPVVLQIICVASGSLTPATGSGFNVTTSDASANLIVESRPPASAAISGYGQSIVSTLVTNQVGSHFYFNSGISASGWAEANATPGFIGSISADITSQTYVDILTADAGYTADSGTIYPHSQLPPPTLYIQATNNTVVLSWLSAYSNFILQQSSSLNPNAWSTNTNAVAQVDNQNQVVIPLPMGTEFYRLKSQ